MSGKASSIIAAVALILMIIAIYANALYIKSTTDHILVLIERSEDVNEKSMETITEIYDYWNKSISILKLSVSQEDLEEISLIINEAQICAENDNSEEYNRTMARLRRAIEDIRDPERILIRNIF